MNMARSRRLQTAKRQVPRLLSASASAACACINASCAVVAAAAAYAAPRAASAAVAARSLRSPVPPQSRSLGGRGRYVAESESMATSEAVLASRAGPGGVAGRFLIASSASGRVLVFVFVSSSLERRARLAQDVIESVLSDFTALSR